MCVLQGALLFGGFVLEYVAAPQLVVLLLVAFKFGFDLQALRAQ